GNALSLWSRAYRDESIAMTRWRCPVAHAGLLGTVDLHDDPVLDDDGHRAEAEPAEGAEDPGEFLIRRTTIPQVRILAFTVHADTRSFSRFSPFNPRSRKEGSSATKTRALRGMR